MRDFESYKYLILDVINEFTFDEIYIINEKEGFSTNPLCLIRNEKKLKYNKLICFEELILDTSVK